MDSRGHVRLIIIGVGPIHPGHIEHKIANLAIEIALVDIPFRARASRNIKVGIHQGDTREVFGTLDGWLAVGIPHELGIVILNNGSTDEVCASREVYYCPLGRCGTTIFPAPQGGQVRGAEGGHGAVDGCRIISNAITDRAEVLNIAEELVSRVCKGHLGG